MKKTKLPLRKLAEWVGLCVLLYSAWTGRHVLADSFEAMKDADLLFVVACFIVAWFNFLWSAIGYKLLAAKIKLGTVFLVHLAASGPGRVIPGGAGHFSFGVLYLKKQKYSLENAVAVATVNNVLGFVVNLLFFVPIFLLKPQYLPDIQFAYNTLYLVAALTIFVIAAFVIYRKNRSVHKSASKTKIAIKKLTTSLLHNPRRLMLLVATMAAQVVTHILVLVLASKALHIPLSPITAFVAMSSGVALGSLVPTPGGIGGVEAGIIASLLTFGLSSQEAASIALVYRSATYIQPLLPGTCSYLYLRRKKLL